MFFPTVTYTAAVHSGRLLPQFCVFLCSNRGEAEPIKISKTFRGLHDMKPTGRRFVLNFSLRRPWYNSHMMKM